MPGIQTNYEEPQRAQVRVDDPISKLKETFPSTSLKELTSGTVPQYRLQTIAGKLFEAGRGTVTHPSYGFRSLVGGGEGFISGYGMYMSAVNELAFAAGGTRAAYFASDATFYCTTANVNAITFAGAHGDGDLVMDVTNSNSNNPRRVFMSGMDVVDPYKAWEIGDSYNLIRVQHHQASQYLTTTDVCSYYGIRIFGRRLTTPPVGTRGLTSDPGVNIYANTATHIPLAITHAATPSANFTEWRASDDSILSYIDPSGKFYWKNGTIYTGSFAHANTGNHVYTFKDADGTVAFTSDLSSYSLIGHTHAESDITNLTTDLSARPTVSGVPVANQLAYWSSASALTGNAGATVDTGNARLALTNWDLYYPATTGNRYGVYWATQGSYDNGPWLTTVNDSLADGHDHAYIVGYNVRPMADGSYSRLVNGSHAIIMHYESRWVGDIPGATPGDHRGWFEWNLNIDPATTGAIATVRPYFLIYEMDSPRKTRVSFGVPTDTSSDYVSIGMAGSWSFVAHSAGNPHVFGVYSTVADTLDSTKTRRLLIAAGYQSGDRAAQLLPGVGDIYLEPGKNLSDVIGIIRLGENRHCQVHIGGWANVGTTTAANADGEFSAGTTSNYILFDPAGPYLSLVSSWAYVPTENAVKKGLWFQSTGSYDNGDWRIMEWDNGTGNYLHGLITGYNVTFNQGAGTYSRPVDGSHAIMSALTSRYTAGDPGVLRGSVEWYVYVDATTTGTPFQPANTKTMWLLRYDMDNSRIALQLGHGADLGESITAGVYGSYSITLSSSRAANLPIVFAVGLTHANAATPTKGNRLIYTGMAGFISGDYASQICAAAGGIRIEPGKTDAGVVGDMYLCYARGILYLGYNAGLFVTSSGYELGFTDGGAGATAAGRLRRNGATLTWHDGTAARLLTMQAAALTSTRIPFADANGQLTDDTGLTYNSTTKILTHTAAGANQVISYFTDGTRTLEIGTGSNTVRVLGDSACTNLVLSARNSSNGLILQPADCLCYVGFWPSSDGAVDLGQNSGAYRWRSLFIKTSIINSGYYRGGTTAMGATAGDWATGITTTGGELFFDESASLLAQYQANTLINQISGVAGTATVFNELGADIDFRVEGDTDANLLTCDASADKVGIGVAAPGYKLSVAGIISATSDLYVSDSAKGVVLKDTAGTPHYWRITVNTDGTLATADLGTSAP